MYIHVHPRDDGYWVVDLQKDINHWTITQVFKTRKEAVAFGRELTNMRLEVDAEPTKLNERLSIIEMKHNPEHRCAHGYNLWWNFGDGKPRHRGLGDEPTLVICDDP